MRILFVLNPTAGGTSKEKWEAGIADYFKDSEHSYELFRMEGDDCSEECRKKIKEFAPDRVGAVGGDGTLKFAAEMLLRSNIPIAFFPAGSANGMARELSLPTDVGACLDILLNGTSKDMDVIRLNGQLSLHLADLGLNARLVKYFDDGRQRGMLGYAKQVIRVMRNSHQMRLGITFDGKTIKRKAWMLVIANARTYGTGATVNPDGSLYDGHFEMVLLKRRWFWEMVRMLVRKNAAANKQLTEVIAAEKATIITTRPAHFQVDGEYIGKVHKVDVSIQKAAIRILVPAGEKE